MSTESVDGDGVHAKEPGEQVSRATPRALTIAGSDSGGGAGIQADLKTFQMLGVFGMTAVTAITAQNTLGVQAVHDLPADLVAQQIEMVATDIGVDAAKTGMLSQAAVIEAVAIAVERHGLTRLVVDPVMVAKGGARLLASSAEGALRRRLLPLAYVVTPNIPEAEVLLSGTIASLAQMREAAVAIHALGPRHVIVKGGHLGDAEAIDIVYDGREFFELRAPRTDTAHTHGTGCTFSAALTAHLARGAPFREAAVRAKSFVSAAIRDGLGLGKGHGPTNHWAELVAASAETRAYLGM